MQIDKKKELFKSCFCNRFNVIIAVLLIDLVIQRESITHASILLK